MAQAHSLVDQIRKSEQNAQRLLRRLSIVYAIITGFYLLLLVVNPDPDLPLRSRIMGGCLVAAFGLFFFMLREQYHLSRAIDYSRPLADFLRDYLPRLRWWNPMMIGLIPMLLLIDISTTLTLLDHYWPDFGSLWLNILSIQMAFWGVMGISLLFGLAHWRRTKKTFADEIRAMLQELQGA